MTTYTITSGHDTSTNSLLPNTANGADTGLLIVGATTSYTFVYFPLPAELAGQTVASATLTGHTKAQAWPSLTVRSRLVTSSWADATLTANRQPTVGSAFVDSAVPSTVVGDQVVLDVGTLMSSVSAGQAWYGFRLENTGVASLALQSFEYGTQTPWTLTVVTTEAPDIPQALVPNGTVVASGKPTLSCDFVDNGGVSNIMGAIQVQIDPAANGAAPAFDSGTVASTVPLLNLASTAYAGLGSGSTTFWRVRVQDTSGLWSGWSDWAAFTYRPQPTLTLLTPAAGVLWDPTTDIVASTSASMSAYRVQITSGTDRTDVKFDSGRLPANPGAPTTIDVPLPQKYNGSRVLVDTRTYQLHVQAWDTYTSRQATPGLPAYVESWTTFNFNDDLAVSPVATLTADQTDPSPAVTLTWTRAAAPDAWVVLRDGQVIARLNPVDVLAGVSTWSWTDPSPKPWIEHTYQVKAISGGHQGNPGPPAFITPDSKGVWIITQDGSRVWLAGNATDQLVINDRRSTYKPLNLRYDVDIVTGFEGLSGTFSGLVLSDEFDGDQWVYTAVDTLRTIRANPGQSVRLIFGMFSGEVLLRNISITPNSAGNAAAPVMNVSFGVNQVGDFD